MKSNLALFILALFYLPATAQETPVNWNFSIQKEETGLIKLVCEATLEPGWYIYSQFLGDDGPIPTSIQLDESLSAEKVGKPTESGHKKEGHDPIFDMNIVKFSKSAIFSQMLKLNSDNATIKGVIEYMTCDDHKCLPPTTAAFSLHP